MHVYVDAFTEEDNTLSVELKGTDWQEIFLTMDDLIKEAEFHNHSVTFFEVWTHLNSKEDYTEPLYSITIEEFEIKKQIGLFDCKSIWQ